MSLIRRALVATIPVAAGLLTFAGPAEATSAVPSPGAVYVLGNQPSGNEVLVFERGPDGTLASAGAYPTGGAGTGGGLGSQGAVVVDDAGRYLYAVNAGSGSISSFGISPSGLELIDVVPSGGTMPTSITVRRGVMYVLNAGGAGNISGFTVSAGDVEPLPDSTRPLSGGGTAPGQVSFTPDGSQLLVTERATQQIDVYSVGRDGLATGPVVLPSEGVTPFGFDFDNKGHVVVSEAFAGVPNGSSVSSYTLGNSTLATVSASVPTTESAACWIATTANGKFAYSGNAGTASITGFRIDPAGQLTILDADGRTASAPAGVTDLAVSRNSQFLYARLGNGTVGAWSIGADGSLAELPAAPGLPAGAAGIAAS